MPEGFSILSNHTGTAPCHPELAAKSVETNSKRDFMPLPGVSGSLNYYNLTLKSACKWYLYLIKTHCGQRFFQFHQELIYQ